MAASHALKRDGVQAHQTDEDKAKPKKQNVEHRALLGCDVSFWRERPSAFHSQCGWRI